MFSNFKDTPQLSMYFKERYMWKYIPYSTVWNKEKLETSCLSIDFFKKLWYSHPRKCYVEVKLGKKLLILTEKDEDTITE